MKLTLTVILQLVLGIIPLVISIDTLEKLNNRAIENFREYLRIPTVQPNVNYTDCINFLRNQAEDIGLEFKVFQFHREKPIALFTWPGSDDSYSSILLNNHMDVVPVNASQWTYPPFSAHMTENGDIYARGSQDMKCVGIQYLEAIRRLKLNDQRLKRTIHVSFVPDEEVSSEFGMKSFVRSSEFQKLNIGFALDEGIASPGRSYNIFNSERSKWFIWVHCLGNTGHSSLLLTHTSGEKLTYMLNKFMEYRTKEMNNLLENANRKLGDVTTINLVEITGGIAQNIIPPELSAGFDIRLNPGKNLTDFEEMLNQWCKEAGEGVYIEFMIKNNGNFVTKLDNENIFWKAFENAKQRLEMDLNIQVNPAFSDASYLRSANLSVLGFSPMNSTPVLMHDNNEFLNKNVFLRGIQIYKELLLSLGRN